MNLDRFKEIILSFIQKIKQAISKFVNKNIIAKLIILIIIWAVALIPAWITIGVWWLVSPTSDVARALVAGGAVVFLGVPQVALVIIGAVLSIGVIIEEI